MNKIIVSFGLSAVMLLAAGTALAAAVAPVPSPTGAMVTGTAIMQGSSGAMGSGQMQSTSAIRVMPCAMMNQTNGSANMMYRTSPCGTPVYPTFMGYNGFGRDTVSWLGIMFVVTVVLVWVILLLVIALLWKHLQKHKHDHHHHEHN